MSSYVDHLIAQEKSLVLKGPSALKRLNVMSLVKLAIGMGALQMLIWWYDIILLRIVAVAILGLYVGACGMSLMRSAVIYRTGWIDGRIHAVELLQDSSNPTQWLNDLATYDAVHVFGATPEIPDTPEGL